MSKNELTPNSFTMYGSGGTDINGEWNWNGSYYAYLDRGIKGLEHHYEIKFNRKGYQGQTKGWDISIWLCLTANNSREIKIASFFTKTLKSAKEQSVKEVVEFEKSDRFEKEVVRNYLIKHCYPVFAIDNNELKLIGTTHNSAGSDMRETLECRQDEWLYYNNDIPDYTKYRHVYVLEKSFQGGLVIAEINCGGGCTCSSWNRDKEMVQKMVDMVWNNSKYEAVLEPLRKEATT